MSSVAVSQLYEQDRHEPLGAVPWNAQRVHEAISKIAADTERRFDPLTFWPAHPLDSDAPDPSGKSLFAGAAGVGWALHYLGKEGAVALKRSWLPQLVRIYEAYRSPERTWKLLPSYLLGEAGILLAAFGKDLPPEAGDRLFTGIRANIGHPANEVYWGTPGTMLAALIMYEWTAEERWRALYLESVEQVWSEWHYAPAYDCYLWTQDFRGQRVQHLGAAHGFAGNVYTLLRGAALMPPPRQAELYRRCSETLNKLGRREPGQGANWPQSVGTPRPGRTAPLLQWCHGAPGIIAAFDRFGPGHDLAVEQHLQEAGELIWKAGPLQKACGGICHGTAGNGYAFLKLYRRTSDARWLARARAFGMHALEQQEQAQRHYGQGRYSLWLGDLGVAVYLWQCLCAQADLPGLDVL